MSDRLTRLAEDRAARNAARANFHGHLKSLAADLERRGLGERIADSAVVRIKSAAVDAMAVARDNKGIVAATLAALVLWLLRNPLLDWVEARFGGDAPDIRCGVQR